MKIKTVFASVLLLFILVSIATLINREFGDNNSESPDMNKSLDTQLPENRVIVYYFHGNIRCSTCNTLEAFSKEAVDSFFSDELNAGQVEWQVINYDETWNEHYLQDYDLSFQSLVLVEIKNGKEVQYVNLEKIWDLVADKPAYLDYVQQGIKSSLSRLWKQE